MLSADFGGIMKKSTQLVLTLLLTVGARADHQMDLDPWMIPFCWQCQPEVSADIGWIPGEHEYIATLSGPSGVPAMYHAVWQLDDQILDPCPINSITLRGTCDYTGDYEETVQTWWQPYYIPGPAFPSSAPPDPWGDLRSACEAQRCRVNDLRLTVDGPVLRLDWSYTWGWGCGGFLVYRLDTPWQSIEDAELIAELEDPGLVLPLTPTASSAFYRVVSIQE